MAQDLSRAIWVCDNNVPLWCHTDVARGPDTFVS